MTRPASGLSAERIAQAVEQAGLSPLLQEVAESFSRYYALLEQWNAKLNLTAIRDPEDALRRHFVECIFCAQQLPSAIGTLLDYGSGAGFPGLPIALCRPEIRVTLAESQGKKASFLREAVRVLDVEAEVFAGRVEDMPASQTFDAVTLRAVDRMQNAVKVASIRVNEHGWLVLLEGSQATELSAGFVVKTLPIPGTLSECLVLASRG